MCLSVYLLLLLWNSLSPCVCVFRSHCDSCIMLPPFTAPRLTAMFHWRPLSRLVGYAALVPFIRCLSSVFCVFFASLYVTQFGSCACLRDRITDFLLYLSCCLPQSHFWRIVVEVVNNVLKFVIVFGHFLNYNLDYSNGIFCTPLTGIHNILQQHSKIIERAVLYHFESRMVSFVTAVAAAERWHSH